MPYWRLSGFYFFYFAALGALVPFWGLYLQGRGFLPVDIGQLMAILMGTKIIAPNVWGWIGDHRDSRMPIVRLASLLSCLIFIGIFFAENFWGMALVMVLFSFFWNASLPQMEVVTFNHLGSRIRRYASIRLWGSVGFALAVLVIGEVMEWTGTGVVPRVVLVIFIGIWLSSLIVPDSPLPHFDQPASPVLAMIGRPEVAAYLTSGFLMQASHGAYYAFYSIYLIEAGYSSAAVGALWAWAVTMEVLLFLIMHRLLERYGARLVLLSSLVLAAGRWLLVGSFIDILWVQVVAQALHAATFGAFHASSIHLAHHYFTGRTQGRGQALYNSLSFGAGGAAGSLVGGILWTTAGPAITFGLSALAAALGWLAAWLWVDRERMY